MKTALILGISSDIAMNLSGRLKTEGWQIFGTTRSGGCDFSKKESIDKSLQMIAMPWDLLIFGVGSLGPIGRFASVHPDEWESGVMVNCLGPLRMFHHLIPHRKPDASAVFFSGTNPKKVNPLYSSYSASKAMLVRAVQEIDSEIDTKCFTLAPGFIRTKIHAVHDVSQRPDGTTHEQIYACLKHLLSRPKGEVGGKVFHVPTWFQLWKELG